MAGRKDQLQNLVQRSWVSLNLSVAQPGPLTLALLLTTISKLLGLALLWGLHLIVPGLHAPHAEPAVESRVP